MKKFINACLCFCLIFLILFMNGCESQYLSGNRNAKWKKDLDYLQKALPNKHVNLFFNISEEEFNKEINDLKESVDTLNDDEIVDGIYKIVASVGDGHTKVYKQFSLKYPLIFYYFKDGLYVIDTTTEYKEVLNCKVTKINGIDINSIENKVSTLITNENYATIKKIFPNYLNKPEILHGLNIIDNINTTKFTFENKDGQSFDLDIKSLNSKSNENLIINGQFADSYPLYMQNRDLNYWYKYLEDSKTLYFKYNKCRLDENSGDITQFNNEILDFIDNNPVNKFVIDLRDNSGGSDGYLTPILEGLKQRKINTSNSFFVIVGRATFSSAIIDAVQLKQETNATFIGEETSGRPNHYGEVKGFKLPNSQLLVPYSTKKFDLSKDDSNTFTPDKIIELSSDDYFNKKDPILDYILDMQ